MYILRKTYNNATKHIKHTYYKTTHYGTYYKQCKHTHMQAVQ